MVKITLYGMDPSPPVRAVKLTLAALELSYEFVEVNVLNKEHLSEAFVRKNPQHTVPMLDDGGAILWDSHAIMAYLVSKYGKDDSLYPKDLLKRAVVDQRMHFESGVVFTNALRSINKLLFFLGAKVVPRERIDAVIEAYDFVESFLQNHSYVAGDHLTIADFSLVTSITSLMAYVKVDSAKYPKLSAWLKRMVHLPYYVENFKGAQQFASAIQGLQFTIATE